MRLERDSAYLDTIALIDTGCSYPVIVSDKLYRPQSLQPCKSPIRFVDASGNYMTGGVLGTHLRIHLPVALSSSDDSFVAAVSPPIWSVSVSCGTADVIIGYPFLRIFRILVDAGSHCLRFSSLATMSGVHPASPSVERNDSTSHSSLSDSATNLVCVPDGEPTVARISSDSENQSRISVPHAVGVHTGARDAAPLLPNAPTSATSTAGFNDGHSQPHDASVVRATHSACKDTVPSANASTSVPLGDGVPCGAPSPAFSDSYRTPHPSTSSPTSVYAPLFVGTGDTSWCSVPPLLPHVPTRILSVQHESSEAKRSTRSLPPSCCRKTRDIFLSESYAVSQKWFTQILEWSDVTPTVDAFADPHNALLPLFWDIIDDELSQNCPQKR